MAEFRHPNITAATTEGQLNQLKTYLFQLTNQLNYALKSAENKDKEQKYIGALQSNKNATGDNSVDKKTEDNFNQIKDLIIKSADIVNAYYNVISKKLEGSYTALAPTEDGYDAFKMKTEQWREESPQYNQDYFKAVQSITEYLGGEWEKELDENGQPKLDENGKPKFKEEKLSEIRINNFYIKTGWLDNNCTIGGIEIGEQRSDGKENEDMAFARFTTDKLSFLNSSGDELAWFGDNTLHIRTAYVEDEINLVYAERDEAGKTFWKGYQLDSTNGLAFLWVEKEAID